MEQWVRCATVCRQGFAVLQTYQFKEGKDHDRVAADRNLGATEAQSFKQFAALAYEEAINYLDTRGMIDHNRVGISGFSRTVCFAAYALTHSQSNCAAGILTDGIDCGYFQ
jgi:dienelactone hydrolase